MNNGEQVTGTGQTASQLPALFNGPHRLQEENTIQGSKACEGGCGGSDNEQ